MRQAAERLLDALDSLARGEIPGFANGRMATGSRWGDAVDEARHELRTELARPTTLYRSFTDEEFEPEIFERIWRLDEVQNAGSSAGCGNTFESLTWVRSGAKASAACGEARSRTEAVLKTPANVSFLVHCHPTGTQGESHK